jgi:predicted ester cyclase
MTLPFALPERPPVTRLRGRTTAELRAGTGERTQALPGFEPQWRDIVHYIVGITEEIWSDMAVDRIRATYADDCVIHTSMGTSRGVEGVVAGTVQSLWAFTDFATEHLNIAWSAEGDDFYTSHLGFARSTNSGATLYGPATGRSLARHFVADCVSRDNKIHTEWLARDNATGLIQMGLDPVAVAQALAQLPAAEPLVPVAPDAPIPDGDPADPAGWFMRQFARWSARAFADAVGAYAPDVTAHWPGQRRAEGPRAVAMLMVGLLASVPDGRFRVEHVCWADDADSPIVAVRWRLDGTSSPYGALGTMPADRPVALIGMSHFRFQGGLIVEEWTVFDEVAVLTQAYRA